MKLFLQVIAGFIGLAIVTVVMTVFNVAFPSEAHGQTITVRKATLGDSRSIKPQFSPHEPNSQILLTAPSPSSTITVREATLGDSRSIKPQFSPHEPSSHILLAASPSSASAPMLPEELAQVLANECKEISDRRVALLELELEIARMEIKLLELLVE